MHTMLVDNAMQAAILAKLVRQVRDVRIHTAGILETLNESTERLDAGVAPANYSFVVTSASALDTAQQMILTLTNLARTAGATSDQLKTIFTATEFVDVEIKEN